MVRFKPTIEERKEKAKEQNDENAKDKEDIRKILEEALDEIARETENNVKGKVLLKKPEEIDYEQIKEEYNKNDASHIIFIQFTKKGHVAVVGAGKDMSFSKKVSRGTWAIISAIEDVEWDNEFAMVIPISNIKNCRIKQDDNILTYRNGVEHYLGDYLLNEDIPILNYYQHKNYCDKFWKECKKNGYRIKKY